MTGKSRLAVSALVLGITLPASALADPAPGANGPSRKTSISTPWRNRAKMRSPCCSRLGKSCSRPSSPHWMAQAGRTRHGLSCRQKVRRKAPQAFQRLAGMDANSCSSCHNEPVIGGSGAFTANVFVSEASKAPTSTPRIRSFPTSATRSRFREPG